VADWDDVRRVATALPSVEESSSYGSLAWRVKDKTFLWERPLRRRDIEELGDAAPEGPVLGARVADVGAKEALVTDDPSVYFTTTHFDGYPAVLVRLDRLEPAELDELATEAWLARAPTRLVQQFLAETAS
jgi:hypothetical protein